MAAVEGAMGWWESESGWLFGDGGEAEGGGEAWWGSKAESEKQFWVKATTVMRN